MDADDSNDYFLRTSTFLEPSTLKLGDATKGAAGLDKAEFLKALPAFFDSSNMEAFQSKATSKDGTTIPYFRDPDEGRAGARSLFVICLRRLRDLARSAPG